MTRDEIGTQPPSEIHDALASHDGDGSINQGRADVGPTASDPHPHAQLVMDGDDMSHRITEMADEAANMLQGIDVVVLGIRTRGVPLSERLAAELAPKLSTTVSTGTLDITMHRDDLRQHPTRPVGRSIVPTSVDNVAVLLVDDVLDSGRTVISALEELRDFGRPKYVRLAVLADTQARELPVRPDVVGEVVMIGKDQRVNVALTEIDGHDSVTITTKSSP